MDYWTYKKANFKAAGMQVYEGYLFGEFKGYYYKEKQYQLVSKKTLKGIQYKEKFVGYSNKLFHRYKDENGSYPTWEQWAEYWNNFDNKLITV